MQVSSFMAISAVLWCSHVHVVFHVFLVLCDCENAISRMCKLVRDNFFPLVLVWASRLDHTPLLINSGEQAHLGNKALFSFELS
jgi:hypothetical protein